MWRSWMDKDDIAAEANLMIYDCLAVPRTRSTSLDSGKTSTVLLPDKLRAGICASILTAMSILSVY